MLEPIVYSELIKGLQLAGYGTCECESSKKKKRDKDGVLALAFNRANEIANYLIQTVTTSSQI